MTVLHIDLTDNNDGELTREGYKFTRKAIVVDPVEQSGRVDDSFRIFEAINDTGVPSIGDAHPAIISCFCKKVRAVAIEPNWIELEITYETLMVFLPVGEIDVLMDSSLIQTEATKDYNGDTLASLSYEYQIGDQIPGAPLNDLGLPVLLTSPVTLMSELPVVPIYVPARVYTINVKMDNTGEDELEALNDLYQGAVNNATWRDYDPRTWLCMGITWRTTDRRTTYQVTVQWQYKFDTYDVQAVFRDPYSGKVPGDVFTHTTEPAFRNYRIQREADFDDLLDSLGV